MAIIESATMAVWKHIVYALLLKVLWMVFIDFSFFCSVLEINDANVVCDDKFFETVLSLFIYKIDVTVILI